MPTSPALALRFRWSTTSEKTKSRADRVYFIRALWIAIATLSLLWTQPGWSQTRLFDLDRQVQPGNPVVDRVPIKISLGALREGEQQEILLPLPDGDMVVKLQPISPRDLLLKKGQAAWTGRSQDGAEVFIMRLGNSIEAEIRRRVLVYRLHTVDGSQGVLEVIDTRRFREAPNDGVVIKKQSDRQRSGKPQPDTACADSADRIDVLVAYTPAARDASGGTLQIQNEIAFAVGRTNLAYANSNVFHRLNLVAVREVSFTEPAAGVDSNALLGQLRSPDDMILDTIHAYRDAARADLVSLIYEVDDSTWCGWGYTTDTADADSTDDNGFSVVQRSCAAANLSFAHETGHNIGARHNRYSNSGTSDHDYNFGHVQQTPSTASVTPWRTVMSYNTICDDNGSFCQRVPWFSNPNVSRSGDATGAPLTAANPEHNVNVFALNDGQVSRYRCAQTVEMVADVWMKDGWEDTGGEPDAAMADKPMWRSPYIWVRNTEDTTNEHEHDHENPVLGETNYVYVKQHNDGSLSENGTLELYYANASTNLNDPANWTLIGSKPKVMASGVDVTQFEWSDLPGTGHYCLLARWNTGSSPLSFTSLGGFVRNSNDVIWRNVEIIRLEDGDAKTVFLMAGDRREPTTFLMIKTRQMDSRRLPWPKMVRFELAVDPKIIGDDVQLLGGVTRVGSGRFLIPQSAHLKVLGPIRLKAGEQSKGALRVFTEREVIKKVAAGIANPAGFEVTVSQIRPKGLGLLERGSDALFAEKGLVLGGVSYTLRLAP